MKDDPEYNKHEATDLEIMVDRAERAIPNPGRYYMHYDQLVEDLKTKGFSIPEAHTCATEIIMRRRPKETKPTDRLGYCRQSGKSVYECPDWDCVKDGMCRR